MSANDPFNNSNTGLDSPAAHAFLPAQSDTVDMANGTRGIYVGGAGDIKLVTVGGETVTFMAVPAGSILPVRAARIWSTGTTATNLVAGGTATGVTHVYLYDRDADGNGTFDETGAGATSTVLISQSSGGTAGNGNSLQASVSGDGGYVAFASDATNLIGADANGVRDIFLRDVAGGTTILVSRSTGAQKLPALGTGVVDFRAVIPLVAAFVALIWFAFPPTLVDAVSISLGWATIMLSVVVLLGFTGQLSFEQVAMGGLAALVAGRLTLAGVPFMLAFFIALAISVPVGVLFALPAIRTKGINLAVVTLGQLPVGPSVGAAAAVLILGSRGVAAAAAAGLLMTVTGTVGGLCFAAWAGGDHLWSRTRGAVRRQAQARARRHPDR